MSTRTKVGLVDLALVCAMPAIVTQLGLVPIQAYFAGIITMLVILAIHYMYRDAH